MSAFGRARVVATPLWTCRTGLSGHGGNPPLCLHSLLNCNVAPAVQRIGMCAHQSARRLGGNGCSGSLAPVDDRHQDAHLAPEPFGLVGAACLVVVVRRGLAFGDFGSDDLLYFGLGEGASFGPPRHRARIRRRRNGDRRYRRQAWARQERRWRCRSRIGRCATRIRRSCPAPAVPHGGLAEGAGG
jgi:hypothetical protein